MKLNRIIKHTEISVICVVVLIVVVEVVGLVVMELVVVCVVPILFVQMHTILVCVSGNYSYLTLSLTGCPGPSTTAGGGGPIGPSLFILKSF